ncbi:MAG: hypothetical protein GC159_23715 [Phycisphaera sp.]|nr:hypothetical protein [Phycisphaera sp.]
MISHRHHPIATIALLTLATWCAASAPLLADEKTDIAELVVAAQRAGYEQHQLEAYMQLWADDAKLIGSRDAAGTDHPVEMGVEQIRLTRKLTFQRLAGDEPLRLVFGDQRVTIDGDTAEFRVESSTVRGAGYFKVGEVYKLRRTDKGWRVYENRWWPIEQKSGGSLTRFNAATWRDLDDDADAAKLSGDDRNAAVKLYVAHRFTEALRHAIVHCSTGQASATDWALRGWIAVQAGKGDDAVKSFNKARELEPRISVPRTD